MPIDHLFILAGMPATGKSMLGSLRNPPANWPLDGWWQDSMMACNLPSKNFDEFPSKLAVEIDFSHIGPDGKPRLGPRSDPLRNPFLKRLAPRYTAIVTLWAPASVLLVRFTNRKANHPKRRQVEELYRDPRRLIEFYRAWLNCVDGFTNDEHWVFDTSADRFQRPEWIRAWVGE